MNFFQTHEYLSAIVDNRPAAGLNLYDILFAQAPVTYTQASQLVWDEIPFANGVKVPAPFTRPCGAPNVRELPQTRANAITFPYIDLSVPLCCDMLQRRTPGTMGVNGQNIGMDNMTRWMTDATYQVVDDWKTRLAVMSSEILTTGGFLVSGPDIQEQIVDFGRDADLTVKLKNAATWNNPTATPLEDIEGWQDLMLAQSGQFGSDWFVGSETWSYIRGNKVFRAVFAGCTSAVNEAGNMLTNPIGRKLTDVQYQGMYRNNRIFLVTGEYKDLDGSMKPFFPKNGFALIGDINPIRAFGMIKNPKANFQAMDYFLSQRNNCKMPEIELESSPLLIPGNINATFFATVS